MSTTPSSLAATDPMAYIRQRDEAEAAKREGKPAPVAPAPVEVKPAEPEKKPSEKEDDEEDHGGVKLPRSARREMNRLREDAAEARGRLAALQEMIDKGLISPTQAKKADAAPVEDVNAKPVRSKFATDEEFTEAMSTWVANQVAARIAQQTQQKELIEQMAAKAIDDRALIPDFDAHAAADEHEPVDWAKQPTLLYLLGTSQYQALALDYFATHADEFDEILAVSEKPEKQVEEFRALEGHLKRVYASLKKAQGEKPPEPSREAKPKAPKLPEPSESAAVSGGSAPAAKVEPMLPGGKINPAWEAQRNQREYRR